MNMFIVAFVCVMFAGYRWAAPVPVLFLFFATKEAIAAARADAGLHGNFRLDNPATPERIRMACEDQFTQKVPVASRSIFAYKLDWSFKK